MLTSIPSPPGVPSGNFQLPFSNIFSPTSHLPFYMQHQSFFGPSPYRQPALLSAPALSCEQKQEKNHHNFFFLHKFCPKAKEVSCPLQSVAGRTITEPSTLFSMGITRGMIILLGLIIPCPLATTSYLSPFRSYSTCSSGSSPLLPALLTFYTASPRVTTYLTPIKKKHKTLFILAPTHLQQKTLSPPQVMSPQALR